MNDLKRVIFHIDVNSAYLSWEAALRLQQGEELDLRTVPSVVGGDPSTRHGIVLARSLPAKKYQIQTGESLFAARFKCRELIIVPPRYHLYMGCSAAMVSLLREYSPAIQRYSIDECFLDFTNMDIHFGEPLKAAHIIRNRIRDELGFTVNIGISNNKLLAKMASEFEKPDKVHTLYPEEIPDKMWPLPVEELFMVGRAMAPKLRNKGLLTIGDIAKCEPTLLEQWFKSYGPFIWDYAHGYESSIVGGDRYPMKGLGNSTTISFDVEDAATAHRVLLSLVETITMRLRDTSKCARVVAVSLKNKDFVSYSHQFKMSIPTDSTDIIYKKACDLFDETWCGEPLRHLGIRLSDLSSNQCQQLSFFEPNIGRYRELDKTIDSIRLKYGTRSIIRSCFINSGLSPLMGGVVEEEYPMMSSLL